MIRGFCAALSVLAMGQVAMANDGAGSGGGCAVLDSREWSAWIDAMPGPDAKRTLHVRGLVDLPTPGFAPVWTVGPADRHAIPKQYFDLAFTPPDGMVAQVITTVEVHFETPAIYPQYRGLVIRCGDAVLAEIDEVIEAH